MTLQTVWDHLERQDKADSAIAAGYDVNLDWVAGYKHALSELREFVQEGIETGANPASTTLESLHDGQLLELTSRAFNLCAAAEAVMYCLPKDDADALRDAAAYFREWFARGQ